MNTETTAQFKILGFDGLSNVIGGKLITDPSIGGKPRLKDPGRSPICDSIIALWTGIIC